jgi:ABC-type oligopeptide transport system substrate-binding subunit
MKMLIFNFLAAAGLIVCAGCSSVESSSEASPRPWANAATPPTPDYNNTPAGLASDLLNGAVGNKYLEH